MARLVLAAIAGVVVGCTAGAALDISAEPTEEIVALALEASVDPQDLEAAAATVGVTPRTYAYGTGLLAPPVPPIVGAVARADCLIQKESGGRDVPNRQGSGATGPGQYMPSTWTRHTALYRQATGYSGPLSLHSLQDVRRVMAWILMAIPSTRREWAVAGC
jgi:hypothetical protein